MDEIEKILENEEDIIIPVKKAWKIIQFNEDFKDVSIPSLGKFIELVKKDERFEFMPPLSYGQMYADLTEDEKVKREIDMEELGFFSGERIKLKRVQLTGELLANIIEKSIERMTAALKNAWDARLDDSNAEKRLLEIMKKAQKLQNGINKVVEKIRNGTEERNNNS